jgi:hypothetical protein
MTDNDLDSYSIEEFCRRNSISRGTYYNMKDAGEGPVEGHALGRVLISKESAFDWRQKITKLEPKPEDDDDDKTPRQREKEKRRQK